MGVRISLVQIYWLLVVFFTNLNNEFLINWCGDDEFCDETLDDTDNINIEDLVDGDVGILKDLVDEDRAFIWATKVF